MTGKQKAIMGILGLFTATGAGGFAAKDAVLEIIQANCGGISQEVRDAGHQIKVAPSEALALVQTFCNPNAAGASDTVEVHLTTTKGNR